MTNLPLCRHCLAVGGDDAPRDKRRAGMHDYLTPMLIHGRT